MNSYINLLRGHMRAYSKVVKSHISLTSVAQSPSAQSVLSAESSMFLIMLLKKDLFIKKQILK